MLSHSSFLKNNTFSNINRVQTHSFPRVFWGRGALRTLHFLWASLSPVWKQRRCWWTDQLTVWTMESPSAVQHWEKENQSVSRPDDLQAVALKTLISSLLSYIHKVSHYLSFFFTVKVFLFYINLICIICWYTLLSFIRWPKTKQKKKMGVHALSFHHWYLREKGWGTRCHFVSHQLLCQVETWSGIHE